MWGRGCRPRRTPRAERGDGGRAGRAGVYEVDGGASALLPTTTLLVSPAATAPTALRSLGPPRGRAGPRGEHPGGGAACHGSRRPGPSVRGHRAAVEIPPLVACAAAVRPGTLWTARPVPVTFVSDPTVAT